MIHITGHAQAQLSAPPHFYAPPPPYPSAQAHAVVPATGYHPPPQPQAHLPARPFVPAAFLPMASLAHNPPYSAQPYTPAHNTHPDPMATAAATANGV